MRVVHRGWKQSVLWPVLLAGFGMQAVAQRVSMENATAQQLAGIAKDNSRHFGDDPDDDGPIATDLSASLDPAAVGKAMRKVGTGSWRGLRSTLTGSGPGVCFTAALWRLRIRWGMRSIAMRWRRWGRS